LPTNLKRPDWLVKGGNEDVLIKGTAKYAKLGNLDQWGKWSCAIYPDQESMVKIHKLISEGVKNKIRKDDDGYVITFSRPAKIKTKSKGEVDMAPVIVENDEGILLDTKFIEDGAEVTMKLETYGGKSPTGFGNYKAARLLAIRVHGMKSARPIL